MNLRAILQKNPWLAMLGICNFTSAAKICFFTFLLISLYNFTTRLPLQVLQYVTLCLCTQRVFRETDVATIKKEKCTRNDDYA
jgi:hypothetical protein